MRSSWSASAPLRAAAGILGLTQMVDRLREDHANARFLAEGLNRIPGITVDMTTVETNIVIFDAGGCAVPPADISARLKARGVLLNPVNTRLMRAVTHYDVDRAACETALGVMGEVVREA